MQFFVWGFLLLVIALIVGAFIRSKLAAKPLPVYAQVGELSLTNQNNETVTLDNLRGSVWIADVIFTRCPLQCIRMTKRMREVQEALPGDSPKFISVTADPEFDTPTVLKKYSQKYGADEARWIFLTGLRSEINRFVVVSLKLVAYEKKPEEREVPADLFLHSTKFVLIDRQGRIRGWFDGDNPASKPEILRAVKTVLKETK